MAGRWTKGLLHLLVGGACAALVAWLTFGFTRTVLVADGAAQVAIVGLVALTLGVVALLLLAPPVRPAEVALARGLLDVDLPEPADTTSWTARVRGLVWAVAVILLGGLSLLTLLFLVPQGVMLVVAALDPGTTGTDLPFTFLDMHRAVLAGVGLVVGALGIALQPLFVVALERLAPRVLGPTDADRLAHAGRERARLLAANELARELHDSVGHALTAIGVQAEAGARVADRDPAFAKEALDRIARTTREAVGELDEVLGTLRATDAAPSPAGLDRVTEVLGDVGPRGSGAVEVDLGTEEAAVVGDALARTAYRVVQEALTNARRHGTGLPSGHVRLRDDVLEIVLENAMAAAAVEDRDEARAAPGRPPTGGRGLVGMRERLAIHDGTLAAGPAHGPDGAVWRLEARLPARGGVVA